MFKRLIKKNFKLSQFSLSGILFQVWAKNNEGFEPEATSKDSISIISISDILFRSIHGIFKRLGIFHSHRSLLAQVYENRETETCQIIQSKTPQKS
jgi:hypothetical protein